MVDGFKESSVYVRLYSTTELVNFGYDNAEIGYNLCGNYSRYENSLNGVETI